MTQSNKQDLLIKIENLRKKMNDLSKSKSLTDPKIIAISQQLDQLLNEYDKHFNKK